MLRFIKKENKKKSLNNNRIFHTNTNFSSNVIFKKKPYEFQLNDIGMPVPQSTDTLYRARDFNLFTNRASVLFGEISRQSRITPPHKEITFTHIQKHSIQEQDTSNFFISMSAQKKISKRFAKQIPPGKKSVLLHIDVSDHHPYLLVDTDGTIAAQLEDFQAEDSHRENEFLVMNLLAFSIKRFEVNADIIEYPFYIEPSAGFKDQYESYCQHHDYTIFKIAQLDPKTDKEEIIKTLENLCNEMVSIFDYVFGKKQNPFHLTIEQFSKQYPAFIESTCADNQSLVGKTLVEKGSAFFKANPGTNLADAYREKIFDCYLDYHYLKPTQPKR